LRQGSGDGLLAIHRALHAIIEVLDPEAESIEAQRGESGQCVRAHRARIGLDRVFTLTGFIEREMPAEMLDHLAQLLEREEGRCAAAKVQLLDRTATIEERSLEIDLALQPLKIFDPVSRIAGNDLVATAVEAGTLAERDVDVRRQRLGGSGIAEQRGTAVAADVKARMDWTAVG
jgi:hypothetical protein